MGIVKGICISEKRGTEKKEVPQAEFLPEWGIEKDAHGGHWHRQVSLLSYEKIQEFRDRGASVDFGAFGENLIVEGFDFRKLPIGTRFRCGQVLLEMTQIGKECHSHCAIYHRMGDCIMPREGVFAVVLEGGTIHRGDEMELIPANLYRTLRDREPNSSCILATGLDGSVSGLRTLWLDDIPRWTNDSHGILSSYEEEIKKAEGSRILEVEAGRIFCEKIGGRKDLVICGAGHVSIPIIQLARQLGFYVTVIEDRPFFADNARRAGADQVICDNFLHGMEQVEGSPDTYFVIVTRGHRYDQDCLRKALTKPNAYIGMMGSKKRVALVKKQLEEEGFSREGLERVHTPIGLAIGAETPEEIAVSILAEIIQEKNVRKRISGYDKELLSGLTSGEGGILCTIVSRKGSAPRQIGTKMLIKRDGTITGTIGGGCAESNVIQKGLHMLRSNQTEPALELVDMTGREAEEAGMVCGGTILVYMETIPQETGGNKT